MLFNLNIKIAVTLALFLVCQKLLSQDFIAGRTTGPFPYLEYGLGQDRLGGAKMTYLDSGIALKVIDSSEKGFKVQLSRNHMAWIPKNQFIADTALKFRPYYLTSSWRVWGDDKYDYVSVSLPEKLPFRSFQQFSPASIVVDVFGATSNTNWITQLSSAREIQKVWYEQVEDDVFRIHIELKNKHHWGHMISYQHNSLRIRIKQQPSSLRPRHLLIAIDAGHGGASTGARGLNTGILEKDYTLMMSYRLKKQLERKGYQVIMTRTSDVDMSMTERLTMLRQVDPDLLISIHLNSSGNRDVKGTSTYYRHIGFRPVSRFILDRMLQLGLNEFGNIGAFNFTLNGPFEYQNVLVEVAFLSNADDEARIIKPGFHKDVARKITKGVNDWRKHIRCD